jgi:hypothetical protein
MGDQVYTLLEAGTKRIPQSSIKLEKTSRRCITDPLSSLALTLAETIINSGLPSFPRQVPTWFVHGNSRHFLVYNIMQAAALRTEEDRTIFARHVLHNLIQQDIIPMDLAKGVLESIPSRPLSGTGHTDFLDEGTVRHDDDSTFPEQAASMVPAFAAVSYHTKDTAHVVVFLGYD